MSKPEYKYHSPNGYVGILYGNSSFLIRDSHGNEIFHTGNRAFDTYEELVKHTDEAPQFIELVNALIKQRNSKAKEN